MPEGDHYLIHGERCQIPMLLKKGFAEAEDCVGAGSGSGHGLVRDAAQLRTAGLPARAGPGQGESAQAGGVCGATQDDGQALGVGGRPSERGMESGPDCGPVSIHR